MSVFSRVVIGYHGCEKQFADALLTGSTPIQDWKTSKNEWDWLGNGIYFFEHSPDRALRWAREKHLGKNQQPAVVGAILQLGQCFDLLDESITSLLAETYEELSQVFANKGVQLPKNHGCEGKLRKLDCFVINECLHKRREEGSEYDTVRCAFLEGVPIYPTSGFSKESHIQIAVRNSACILGIFKPNI